MSGKSIKLYLVDGAATGLVTAEIGQWTGKALVIPRPRIERLAGRPEATRPGVYVLSGPDPDREDRNLIYIGEAENVFDRLRQHIRGKDFWTSACVFTASDEQLTKAHVKYLESRLIELAKDAGRASIDNGNSPPRPALPESDVTDMEFFLDQALVLLPVLGFSFVQPVASRRPQAEKAWQFELSNAGTSAKAREDDDGFVVLKGSTTRKAGVDSWTGGRTRRDQLVEHGVLVESKDPKYFVFAEDYAFSSPSTAASVIIARNTNGRQAWKDRDTGHTYADWQETRIEDAELAAERLTESPE